MPTQPNDRDPRPGGVDAGRREPTLLPAGWLREAETRAVEPPEETRPARRPRWDVLLAVALAVAALVVTLLAVGGLGGSPPSPPRAAAAAPATPAGTEVVVARSGERDLRVTERLVLLRPAPSVRLTRPDLSASRSLRLPRPVLTDLTANGVGGPLRVTAGATGWLVEPGDGTPLRQLTIEYTSVGAVVPEPQAPVTGRALLVVTPVTAPAARDASAAVTVRAPGIVVRQAVCVTSPVTQQLCGTPGEPAAARLTSWQGAAVVVMQADLD